MKRKKASLYERLPEIYRERDAKQHPKDQLSFYKEIYEKIFSTIHENIESLYHDFFIENCAEWVIPNIGDLLGVSPLRAHTLDEKLRATCIALERLRERTMRWTHLS